MKKNIVFGIQGGKGSFNEQAILKYLKKKKILDYEIKYLYTTKNVFQYLYKNKINYGFFAVFNNLGGIVKQSVEVMIKYKYCVIDRITIQIRHFLMKKKNIPLNKIDKIMAHPQVFAQCQKTLEKKYPYLKQISGQGNLIDTASAAKALFLGKIDKNTAILGPKILAKIYDFEIIDENLQDDKKNKTTFLLVKRF